MEVVPIDVISSGFEKSGIKEQYYMVNCHCPTTEPIETMSYIYMYVLFNFFPPVEVPLS